MLCSDAIGIKTIVYHLSIATGPDRVHLLVGKVSQYLSTPHLIEVLLLIHLTRKVGIFPNVSII